MVKIQNCLLLMKPEDILHVWKTFCGHIEYSSTIKYSMKFKKSQFLLILHEKHILKNARKILCVLSTTLNVIGVLHVYKSYLHNINCSNIVYVVDMQVLNFCNLYEHSRASYEHFRGQYRPLYQKLSQFKVWWKSQNSHKSEYTCGKIT